MDNTFIIIVATVIIVHFLVGIGYLMYKINSSPPKEDKKNTDSPT